MANKLKRKEFEESKWIISPVDCMDENPKANPNCKTCRGHGILDDGDGWGCVLVNCTDCWN